jgi:hypothetical protein
MMERNGTTRTLPVPIGTEAAPARVSSIAQLAAIPEEEIWLQKQKSPRTRRAYRIDVQHLMRTLGIGYWAEGDRRIPPNSRLG